MTGSQETLRYHYVWSSIWSFEGGEPTVASSYPLGEAQFISRLILVTGGARAGKSRFAQRFAEQGPYRKRLFVATAVACDPEMRERIARHQRSRNGLWKTLEEPTQLPERLPKRELQPGTVVLVDCLPTFVSNLLLQEQSSAQIKKRIRAFLKTCQQPGVTTLFVSNEVGLGLVPEHPLGRVFRDLLGEVNQLVAASADEVQLLVAGLPVRLK